MEATQQTQADPLVQAVQAAIKGYLDRHPEASAEQINAFGTELELRMRTRQRNSKSVDLRQARNARSQAVGEKIKSLGLKTTTSRKVIYGTLMGIEIGGDIQPTGGMTVAYKVEGEKTIVAAAICSDDDNFDRLAGRELAVDRFAEGLTLTLDTPKIEELDPEQVHKQYLNVLEGAKAAQLN